MLEVSSFDSKFLFLEQDTWVPFRMSFSSLAAMYQEDIDSLIDWYTFLLSS